MILAIAMVLVIVTGHIDLSVGSVMGFTGAVSAVLMIRFNFGVFETVVLTILTGLVIGCWHGFWIAYRKVPAFIVTLASMLAFRGAIIGISGGQTLGLEMAPTNVANMFKAIGQNYLATITPNIPEGQIHDTSLYFAIFVILMFVISEIRKRRSRVKYSFHVIPLYLEIIEDNGNFRSYICSVLDNDRVFGNTVFDTSCVAACGGV